MTTTTTVADRKPPDLIELRNDIAETRAALGDTLAALSDKFDVKSRATHALSDVRAKTTDAIGRTPVIPVLLGVAATAAVLLLVWRVTDGRRRR